jgi:hypothetical protein
VFKIGLFAILVNAGVGYAADASAVLRGEVRAQVPSTALYYGDFAAEVSVEGLEAAVKDGFDGQAVDLRTGDPGDDECEYAVRSRRPVTINVRIYRTTPGTAGPMKVVDRAYSAVLYASQAGMKPCLPFVPTSLGVLVGEVLSVKDLGSEDEYMPTRKVISTQQGPHGLQYGWDTYTVLSFFPELRVPMGESAFSMADVEVLLNLTVSEYGKVNGRALMSESGTYYHGFSALLPLN